MSAAVAPALAASLSTASNAASPRDRQISPRQFSALATSTSAQASSGPLSKRARSNDSPEYAGERQNPTMKSSPLSLRNGGPPAIKVKKEPGSPALVSSRPRPKRLDLSGSASSIRGPQTARPAPLTAGLAMQDVGFACLSPGFQTNDPSMREQLQRSLDVRDQQRQIIEARQKGFKPGSAHDSEGGPRSQDTTLFGVPTCARTPSTSRRKGPPPGLSINAPSAAQFSNDRVIQSAPLHQTFTGLRPGEFPRSRHAQHGPSGLSQSSHTHQAPAAQTNNRLPPFADVFPSDRPEGSHGHANSSPRGSHLPPPLPSPGFPPPQYQHASSAVPPPTNSGTRPREFRSSEEAIQSMSGGREDMLPKVVHYGGVQPPTPPSPMPPHNSHGAHPHHHHHHQPHAHQQHQQHDQYHRTAPSQSTSRSGGLYPHDPADAARSNAGDGRPDMISRTASMNGRRRGRDEYERDQDSSPPFVAPRPPSAAFGPPSGTYYAQRTGGSDGHHGGAAPHASEYKRPSSLAVRGDDRERERERFRLSEEDWRTEMGASEKREEFLRLMEKAWDLFHS